MCMTLISILLAWSRAVFLLLTERVHIPMHNIVMMQIRSPMPQPEPIIMYWIVGSSQKWVVLLVVSATVVEVRFKESRGFANVVGSKHLSSIVKWNSNNNSNVTYSKKIKVIFPYTSLFITSYYPVVNMYNIDLIGFLLKFCENNTCISDPERK